MNVPRDWWYPACRVSDLRRRPLAITSLGTPVVLFRDGTGTAQALVDRCPHRNAPLSMGRVHRDGALECGYHGWRFDGRGHCVAVAGLPSPGRDVDAYSVVERDGFVWIWGEPGVTPTRQPFALPEMGGPSTGEVIFPSDLECGLPAALENSLDVPHTAFLHGGAFRGGEPAEIVAVRSALPDGVEVQYYGEPVRFGPLHLAGLTFDHWDRFVLPSIAQIEYRVQGWLHITNTILHLPVSATKTRAWFVVRYWSRLPSAVVGPIVQLRGRKILGQDEDMLARQSLNIARFGGERFASTELDLMGNAIRRLLRQAESGEDRDAGRAAPPRTVTFRI
jgi:phenylpropionate dioxygenase-like ring-hydroxylating dioxygenase large terminal subunit